MSSIRRQLLLWLLAGLLLSIIVAAFAVYTRARAEARALFDYQLQLMAAAFPNEGFGSATAPPLETDNGNVVVVQIWDRNGAQLYVSRPGAPPPESADIGFSNVETPNGNWRVYNTIVGNNIVQVSQPRSVREELAAGLALRTMLPLLILLPVLIVLIWITVGRGLKPLNELAGALSKRSAAALDPLPDHDLPSEVRPLVAALNDLLARLAHALRLQRSFIADAAHELRTPLTAVSLQTQLAERAVTDEERATALVQLKGGTERAVRVVQQLLTLARSEPEAAERAFTRVNLTAVAREAVTEQAPIAEVKGVDLGLSSASPIQIMGDEDALRIMLGNLIDNAVKYTPAGGTVDVEAAVQEGQVCLVVADTGRGIPRAKRQRVFERFYRYETSDISGSGLGLAIVQRIAERHGASVEFGEGHGGQGLKVTVRFPKQ